MSNSNQDISSSESLNEKLDKYHDKTRYKLSIRLTSVLSIIFLILAISFWQSELTDFLTMVAGFIICVFGLLFTLFTKKYLTVFYTLSIAGVLLTSFAMFTFPTATHYADFLWLFSSILLAFFGINKKVGYVLMVISLISIVVFCTFYVNRNIEMVEIRTPFQQLTLALELIGAMGSGMYILYLFVEHHYFSVRLMSEANDQLQFQFDTINSTSKENETLIKEVHHRVKNNLQIITSLLRMQSKELEDETSKNHFNEAIKRVMTMSLIHQKLYQNRDLSEINLKNYIESLTNELQQFVQDDEMHITTNISVEQIGMKTIVPLGLLINELVSNSIKYVIPQKEYAQIFITFEESSHGYTLTYQDNGSWEEENELSEFESTGFGTELIDILTEQMEGTKELTKGLGNSKYEFHIRNLDLE